MTSSLSDSNNNSKKMFDHDSVKSQIIEEVINIFDELGDYINSLNIEIKCEIERKDSFHSSYQSVLLLLLLFLLLYIPIIIIII